ncbi:RIP metalloprotease RseP, partial [human gut metagenome]
FPRRFIIKGALIKRLVRCHTSNTIKSSKRNYTNRIITIDGKKISTWDDIRPSLQGTANHGVTVVVEREGQTIETTVIPKMEQ